MTTRVCAAGVDDDSHAFAVFLAGFDDDLYVCSWTRISWIHMPLRCSGSSMSVCLSLSLSVCLSVCLSFCLYVYLSVYVCVFFRVCLSVSVSVSVSVAVCLCGSASG